MKNLLKLSLLITGITLTVSVNAQTDSRTAPASPSATLKQDTTKKIVPATPGAKGTKPAPAPPDAKGGNGTNKMAINEQGVPTKVTPRKNAAGLSTETPPPEAPKKKE